MIKDPEMNLHVVEVKLRLKPADAALLSALASSSDIPRAVLGRTLLRREMYRLANPAIQTQKTEGPFRGHKS